MKMFSKKRRSNGFTEVDDGLNKDIRLSILEGAFATIMGTLIGGAFLTGFALILGANSFIIGILASIPLMANLVQIIGSYIISRLGSSKRVCLIYIFLHRLLWIVILSLPFFIFRESLKDIRVWLFIVLIGIGSVFASISSVSWMSWISNLIPEEIRGRFFARRDIAARVVGMILVVLAGRFIDYWNNLYSTDSAMQSYGFAILFAVGTLAGFISILLLKKMSAPREEENEKGDFLEKLKLPLRDRNFRRFIQFSLLWGFSVNLVGPFFNVYMIKNLGVPFSLISLFSVAAGISAILGLRLIGKVADNYGPKPLFFLCGIGAAMIPFLWIFASQDNYSIIWLINIVSGACWAGIGLASSNIMISLAPVRSNSVYFAVFAAITGISSALAPILGGFIGTLFSNLSINFGIIKIANLQLLFLLSTLMRMSSLLLLRPVNIDQNASVKEVLQGFKNWQKVFPVSRSLSITNQVGKFSHFISSGMINLEEKVEKLGNLDKLKNLIRDKREERLKKNGDAGDDF